MEFLCTNAGYANDSKHYGEGEETRHASAYMAASLEEYANVTVRLFNQVENAAVLSFLSDKQLSTHCATSALTLCDWVEEFC